jgi:hypothetical protein
MHRTLRIIINLELFMRIVELLKEVITGTFNLFIKVLK